MEEGEKVRKFLILALATCGGVGFLPWAPGTWGSLMVGMPLWWLLAPLSPWSYGLAWAGLLALSLWAAGPAQAYLGRLDPPAIVVDEVAGLLVALAGVPLHWPWALAGFFIFRFLDIVKPWPIRWLSQGSGGLDIVIDDLAAGIMARLVLEIVMVLWGGGRGS